MAIYHLSIKIISRRKGKSAVAAAAYRAGEKNQLSRITLITFEKLIFPEIEQEVCVLIGEKGGEEKGIRIIEMDTLEDFKALDLRKNGYQKVQHVKEKWTKYFVSASEAELIQTLRVDDRFTPFKEYGIINIGITTGNPPLLP